MKLQQILNMLSWLLVSEDEWLWPATRQIAVITAKGKILGNITEIILYERGFNPYNQNA